MKEGIVPEKKPIPIQETGWKPGNYSYIEDVPNWEKQLAYFDITEKMSELMKTDNDLEFAPEELEAGQRLAENFNAWYEERIEGLSEEDKKELKMRLGEIPAEVQHMPGNEIPFRLNFHYMPTMEDYRDLFAYEYKGEDSKYWPKKDGLLPHREKPVETGAMPRKAA